MYSRRNDTTESVVSQESTILDLMAIYYTKYYRDELGLPDWQKRVAARASEEQCSERVIGKLELWSNEKYTTGKKILIVGSGTGAEFIAFSQRGCDVLAIEPNHNAVEIAHLKAKSHEFNPERIIQGYAESLPFVAEQFDLVWCFTVLEHVNNVYACIDEMVRVAKPGGKIFIVTPDYRQWYEPHYKMFMPMWAPKWLLRCWLYLRGRPTFFLNSLQFISSRMVREHLRKQPVTAMQVIHPWTVEWQGLIPLRMACVKFMASRLGIQRDQYWIVIKNEL
jgi:SAM-dependent methyltransferase